MWNRPVAVDCRTRSSVQPRPFRYFRSAFKVRKRLTPFCLARLNRNRQRWVRASKVAADDGPPSSEAGACVRGPRPRDKLGRMSRAAASTRATVVGPRS